MLSESNAKRMRGLAGSTAMGLVLAAGFGGHAHADPAHTGQPRAMHLQAQKMHRQGSYTHHAEVQRTEHGHTRSDTWTGDRGRTATRQAEVVNDPADRTRTRDVQWTGPNGQQANRTDVTQRTDDGYTRNSTATGPNGGTVERDVVATHDQATGTWVKDVTVERNPPPRGGN